MKGFPVHPPVAPDFGVTTYDTLAEVFVALIKVCDILFTPEACALEPEIVPGADKVGVNQV